MTKAKYKYDLIFRQLPAFRDAVAPRGKGRIIETGAGMPLYTALCDNPNTASVLVRQAFSPTDWDLTRSLYNIPDGIRAVSPDTCGRMLADSVNSDVFTFVDTIQIGNDCKTQTHGWVGYSIDGVVRYYHFSLDNFHGAYNRRELIETIELILLEILFSRNAEPLRSGFIDKILDSNFKDVWPMENILHAGLAEPMAEDTYQVYNSDGTVSRLNDFLRTSRPELVVYKGAFNPPHPQHLNMYSAALSPDRTVVCMISVNNRDPRKHVSVEDLARRITVLNSLGITVLVNRRGLFVDVIQHMSTHPDFRGKRLSFLCGDDTLSRFVEDEKHGMHRNGYPGVKFYTARRNDAVAEHPYHVEYLRIDADAISSTLVRRALDAGDFGTVSTLYMEHKELHKLITKHYTI